MVNNYAKYGLDDINVDVIAIDYDGYVDISNMNLTEIPFEFRYVTFDFDCSDNKLTSLEGAPQEVGGNFYCYNNNLTSLKGAPKEVSGGFYCQNNPNLPQSEKDWAKKNIKAMEFVW